MTEGLRRPAGLTAWRGRSGRRYVAGVHALDESEVADDEPAVVLAVERRPDGEARLVGAACVGGAVADPARTLWFRSVRARGATEIHVHRLAESEGERLAVVADLEDTDPV